jgi:tetratricopeptide (TPR) repeat protein
VWAALCSTMKALATLRRLCLVGAVLAVAVAAYLHRLKVEPISVRNPFSPAALQESLAKRPSSGPLHAQLALALLQPVDEVAPNAGADSLYDPDFTLHHPNVAESRKAMEVALKLSPSLSEAHLAHQAVLMAEGRAEEAIQPGRRALDLNPTSAHAYTAWARSHLLAACAQGCAARESLREEKKKEKAAGRAKTQLEAREEEQRTQMERREMAKDRKPTGKPPMDRGQLRAGAMWRIMEAGRLWKQGAAAEPESEEAQQLHRMSKRLITLDAFKVLNTEQVIQFGQCEHFFGQELDGHTCDKKRYKYE